jgi:NAD(P)-dependent dehydrogenase (short-subunit alcohol dehydrogenase family)
MLCLNPPPTGLLETNWKFDCVSVSSFEKLGFLLNVSALIESVTLQGKSALITGSTSGIGLAIARALAAKGTIVTINGFGDKDAMEKERASIEKDYKVKAVYSTADMSKPNETADMVRNSEETLDVLVSNGVQFVSPIKEFPVEKWDQIIAINLSSAFTRSAQQFLE